MTSIKPIALLKGEGLPDYDKITPNEITENIPKLIKELNEKLNNIDSFRFVLSLSGRWSK